MEYLTLLGEAVLETEAFFEGLELPAAAVPPPPPPALYSFIASS